MVGESTQIELVPSGKIRTAPHSSNVNRQENERSWVFRLCNTPPEIAKTELDSTKADCSSCSISPSTEDHAGASWIYSNPSLTNWSLESRDLCRLQSHFGTQMECTYSMMTFGIPLDAMPLDDFGNIEKVIEV